MEGTRKVITNLLKRSEAGLTVTELCQVLKVTPMAVRRHLAALERDGLVQTDLKRQAWGRPAYVYFLTGGAEAFFPKNYAALVLELLSDLVVLDGEEKLDLLFQRRKERLKAQYFPRLSGSGLAEKVQKATEVLNENGHMAEWSKLANGPLVLKEFNCPILAVARRFRKICEYERELWAELFSARVVAQERISSGDPACVYYIYPEPPHLLGVAHGDKMAGLGRRGLPASRGGE